MVWSVNLNARQKSPTVESKRSRVKTAERQIKNAPASKRPKIKTRSRQVENARASNQKWARVKTADRQNGRKSKRYGVKPAGVVPIQALQAQISIATRMTM